MQRDIRNVLDSKNTPKNHCLRDGNIDTKCSDDLELKPMIHSKQSLDFKNDRQGNAEMVSMHKILTTNDSTCIRKSKEMSCYMLLSIVLLFILTHSFRLAFKIYETLVPNSITSENYDRCYAMGR